MIGYHYTSWENWQQIKREGLKPYGLKSTIARHTVPEGTKGIWTWAKPLEGSSEFGQVVWTIIRRDCKKVVRLSYEYDKADVYPYGQFKQWTWQHDLSCSTPYNETIYHKAAPAHVLVTPIPPDRITCERVFEIASTEP